MTSAQLLDEINTAISAVLINQTYRLGDRTYTRANLRELRELRTEVRAEVALEAGDNPTISVARLNGTF